MLQDPLAFGLVFNFTLLLVGLLNLSTVLHRLAFRLSRRGPATKGGYVAEVWLEWEMCRGSTMYRQRFATRRGAYLASRGAAFVLDVLLPRYFMDTDYLGRPCRYRHNFAILFGVREVTEQEQTCGVPLVWSSCLPGEQGYAGEHRMAHPLVRDEESRQLHAAGYKF